MVSDIFLTFIILIIFWISLAGQFDPIGIVSGMIYCAFISRISSNLIFKRKENVIHAIKKFPHFLFYVFYYLKDIVLANIDVAKLVLSPKMLINPQIVEYESTLKNDFALTVLSNSITITPGTVTVDIINGKLLVHAIEPSMAEGILNGDLDKRIAKFGVG